MTTIAGAAISGGNANGTSATGANALGALSANFGDFLKLLMTQLKNQDPTSPMDANQFTTELVQFSSVEQQVNTNTSLNQLIQLTQTADVTQASAILGKQVTARSSQIALRDGTGGLTFSAPAAENVSIAILGNSGQTLRQTTVKAAPGENNWTWDGKNTTGQTLPDGAYSVAITGGGTALPFTVTGTATGVTMVNNTVNLQLGALTVPFNAVASVGH